MRSADQSPTTAFPRRTGLQSSMKQSSMARRRPSRMNSKKGSESNLFQSSAKLDYNSEVPTVTNKASLAPQNPMQEIVYNEKDEDEISAPKADNNSNFKTGSDQEAWSNI